MRRASGASVFGTFLLCGLLAAVLGACGAPPSAPRHAAPETDRDPLPYTPPPAETALAGELGAVSASGGEDQARRMLPRLIDALRAGDASERALAALFHDEVGLVADQRATTTQPRSTLVVRLAGYARRGLVSADASVADLFDLEALQVTRASAFFQERELPGPVFPTDLVVAAPIEAPGRVAMGALFGWRGRAHLVVRPGPDARIVAY